MPADSVSGVTLTQRLEYRLATAPGWLSGRPSGDPTSEFWVRFRDGREPPRRAGWPAGR